MPRPTTLPDPWRSLAKKLGGVGALASALGTASRTVNRWARGDREPTGTAQKAIAALFAAHNLEPPCWP